jgi:hypothetical protein
MTTLDIHSTVLAMPHREPENPLPPLRLLGDLHDDVDGTGLEEETARNIRYGHQSSVLPYLLQDDYSRELAPRESPWRSSRTATCVRWSCSNLVASRPQ